MNKPKQFLYTVAAGAVIGGVLGMLFAPDKGAVTRQRIRNLKERFSCGDDIPDDGETLDELKELLEQELAKINRKINSIS